MVPLANGGSFVKRGSGSGMERASGDAHTLMVRTSAAGCSMFSPENTLALVVWLSLQQRETEGSSS